MNNCTKPDNHLRLWSFGLGVCNVRWAWESFNSPPLPRWRPHRSLTYVGSRLVGAVHIHAIIFSGGVCGLLATADDYEWSLFMNHYLQSLPHSHTHTVYVLDWISIMYLSIYITYNNTERNHIVRNAAHTWIFLLLWWLWKLLKFPVTNTIALHWSWVRIGLGQQQ